MFRRSARQPPTQLPTPARKTRTRIHWLLAAVTAVTGGLAAGTIPAQAQEASLRAYSATISATSPHALGAVHGKVDGYALVYYEVTYRKENTATISGAVTGAASGDVVTLLAEPFRAKAFAATGTPITLSSPAATTPYSFAVRPSVATRYEIQVTTSGQVDVRSHTVTVYVSHSVAYSKGHTKCTSTTCTFWWRNYIFVPPSAYRTEAAKHVYLYLTVGYPRLPRYFTLSKTAWASKARKINSGEFEQKFTFYIKLRHDGAYWNTFYCLKDSETRDGLGLPGRHGCGDERIRSTRSYFYVG